MPSEALEAVDASGLGLRVEFGWRSDRFGHAIWLLEPDRQPVALLESIEGTAAEAWPPSPPLQSLSIENMPADRRAALLVGMAGRSHWSASVEVSPGVAAVDFDVACRTSDRTGDLRSTYRLLFDNLVEAPADDVAGCRWTIDGRGVELVVSPVAEVEVSSERGEVTIRPVAMEGQQRPTVRWRYRTSLERSGTKY